MNKFVIEKSLNKKDTYEIWKLNTRKGYYNFISYIKEEEINAFRNSHKKDKIIEKW